MDSKENSAYRKEAEKLRSENKLLKEQLNELTNKYSNLFESSPDIVSIIDINGKIVACCNRAADFYSLENKDLIGLELTELLSPDSLNNIQTILDKLKSLLTFSEEVRIKTGTGFIVEIQRRYSPISDKEGQFVGAIVYDRDITQRKRNEEIINLHSAALETTATSMVITNLRGDVVWVNDAFTKLTGYEKEEITYKNINILKSGKHEDSFYKELWETISKGEVWHGEVINKHKNGSFLD